MDQKQIIYTVLLAASVLFFLWSCYARFGLLAVGKPENRLDRLAGRLWDMLVYAFAQKRVVSRPFGFNHFFIFWSFIILLLANGEFMVSGLIPALTYSNPHLPAALVPYRNALFLLFDLVSVLALATVVIAMVRRTFFPPYPGGRTADAYVILTMIGALMLAFFGYHGAEIARGGNVLAQARAFAPVSSAVAGALGGMTPEGLERFAGGAWWVHALVLLAFLGYLPYSKHMHILTAIPNCFFRRLGKPNTQPRETFHEGLAVGGGQVDRYTWKDLLDAYSCTECARCQIECPATSTGKPLNPRLVVHDMKVNLLENGPRLRRAQAPAIPLIGDAGEGSVPPDAIWSCTTCGACMEACPVFIEQMPKLVEMRRHLVEMEAKFPEELLNLFENMEQRSNPWGIAPAERAKWYAQMEVKPFDAETEYLFFVGCAGAFDARNKVVTVSLASILDAAGLSWGVLGKEEMCCGDSLRRLGNEYIFDDLARQNVKLFRERGVKKIITQCPHCFSTLKNDYRQFGLEVEVLHHSELIHTLLREGKLPLKRRVKELGRILFHDSCYLGRHNDIYDAPREVIAAANGSAPKEMGRNRSRSFCCGAGGGRMWMEEGLGTRINLERTREALAHRPNTICVTCPYCLTMIEDGLKDVEAGDVRVQDIAEVVAMALQEPTGEAVTSLDKAV